MLKKVLRQNNFMNLIIYNTKNNIKNSLILNIITIILLILLFFTTKNIYTKYLVLTKISTESLSGEHFNKEEVFLIKQKNEKENIFLFNASKIDNDTLIEIKNVYNEYSPKIIKEYSLPTGVITRISSYALTVYGIELEDNINTEERNEKNENYKYREISENMIYGKMFEKGKNEIVIGSFASSNMNLNTNEYVSFLRRNERGWLDSKLFFVKGIFSLDKYNDNIFSDDVSVSNFIFSKEGGRSAYRQNIYIVFDEKVNAKKIISTFNKSKFSENYEIEYTKTNTEKDLTIIKLLFKSLFVIFILSFSLITAALNNLQIAKRLSYGFVRENKPVSKRSLTLQIYSISLISILISYLILLIFSLTQNIFYILYPSLSVIISSSIAVFISIIKKHKKENI